jgi:lipoprotein-anchoring transpeptidase ErfK/SrfK
MGGPRPNRQAIILRYAQKWASGYRPLVPARNVPASVGVYMAFSIVTTTGGVAVRSETRHLRLRTGLAAGLVLALSGLAACSGPAAPPAAPPTTSSVPAPTTEPPPPILASKLVLSPGKTANIAPGDDVTAELVNGTLDTVKLTGPGNTSVAGAFSATKGTWTATKVLAYNTAYTLTASGIGADGQKHTATRAFTTAKARLFTMPSLWSYDWIDLKEGGTYGVGQVIVVRFDENIKDKANAERNLIVTTDPPVQGAWRWMDDSTVHFRPRDYWPAGTKVKVTAKVQGKNLGNGIFGQASPSVSFKIGKSKIAIADSRTHRMTVYIDGQLVTKINGKDVTAGIPISMGKNSGEHSPAGWIDFRTASGPHVVLNKFEVKRMTSASYGITNPSSPNYYDERIAKAVRISGSGEYVHLADWNIPQHGKENTSHGCINVAPTYIYWFYNQFNAGDVVDVRNTGRQLELRDGLGDWTISWDRWVKGSALQ